MKLAIILFIFGTIVPFVWQAVGFILFNIPQGTVSNVFWVLVYTTCPSWLIFSNEIAIAIANGVIYCSLYLIFSKYVSSRT